LLPLGRFFNLAQEMLKLQSLELKKNTKHVEEIYLYIVVYFLSFVVLVKSTYHFLFLPKKG